MNYDDEDYNEQLQSMDEDPDAYMEWSGGWTRDEVESGFADAFDGEIDALWNID